MREDIDPGTKLAPSWSGMAVDKLGDVDAVDEGLKNDGALDKDVFIEADPSGSIGVLHHQTSKPNQYLRSTDGWSLPPPL